MMENCMAITVAGFPIGQYVSLFKVVGCPWWRIAVLANSCRFSYGLNVKPAVSGHKKGLHISRGSSFADTIGHVDHDKFEEIVPW